MSGSREDDVILVPFDDAIEQAHRALMRNQRGDLITPGHGRLRDAGRVSSSASTKLLDDAQRNGDADGAQHRQRRDAPAARIPAVSTASTRSRRASVRRCSMRIVLHRLEEQRVVHAEPGREHQRDQVEQVQRNAERHAVSRGSAGW